MDPGGLVWDFIRKDNIMNAQERKKITGGLSKPSKMPGYAYNLPAIHCKTGSKLAQVPGTTCHGCYALKGRYRFPNVMDAMMRRLASISRPDWARTMAADINARTSWFRWHDSGDIQSVKHLLKIFQVCQVNSRRGALAAHTGSRAPF